MGYSSLKACVADLEKQGYLIRIKEEVDPYLEMSAIQLRVFQEEGKAVFFENVKGSDFPAVSNLFGTLERSRYMFRDSLNIVKDLIDIKVDPSNIFKHPFRTFLTALNASNDFSAFVRGMRVKFRALCN